MRPVCVMQDPDAGDPLLDPLVYPARMARTVFSFFKDRPLLIPHPTAAPSVTSVAPPLMPASASDPLDMDDDDDDDEFAPLQINVTVRMWSIDISGFFDYIAADGDNIDEPQQVRVRYADAREELVAGRYSFVPGVGGPVFRVGSGVKLVLTYAFGDNVNLLATVEDAGSLHLFDFRLTDVLVEFVNDRADGGRRRRGRLTVEPHARATVWRLLCRNDASADVHFQDAAVSVYGRMYAFLTYGSVINVQSTDTMPIQFFRPVASAPRINLSDVTLEAFFRYYAHQEHLIRRAPSIAEYGSTVVAMAAQHPAVRGRPLICV